jgi:hypothetical protein
MLIEHNAKDVSEILNEKKDYKYEKAENLLKKLDEKKIR